MKKLVNIFLLTLVVAVACASDIECVGTATQVVNGKDTLFIFKDEIHLKSTLGAVDWYSTETNTIVSSGMDEIYPDDGGYYIVNGGVQSAPVYAFLYTEPQIDSLVLIPDCESTTLQLFGDDKPFEYTRPDNTQGKCARRCSINFNILAWQDSVKWAEKDTTMMASLHEGNYILPALYDATLIRLSYDTDLRTALGLSEEHIEIVLPAEEIVAVNMNLTTLVTKRGIEGEKSNERNRPTTQDLIVGSEYSGPLDIDFYANPTPAARFYKWTVYEPTTVFSPTGATDQFHYRFTQSGSYRVVCSVSNSTCTADSMEVTVQISESYLAVPNVFTPNGDGQNDEFRVAYRSIKEFHCWVYNRWGKLIYEWTDPAKGWDGTIGGRQAAEGAYFYVIRALGTDAPADAKYYMKPVYNKKKIEADASVLGVYQLSGDINLLR